MTNTMSTEPALPTIERSSAFLERAERRIPCATQTLAKGPGQYVRGVAPVYLQRGSGSHVWDVDGNEYIDLTMGVGPVVLGYTHPVVDQAIRRQLEDGITFSLMHPLEVEVAERIHRLVPGAESIRFSKTGCDVTSAAVRLARAWTGRSTVLCCGYHGWHDWYIATTDRNRGIVPAVADTTFTFDYDDFDSLVRSIDGDVAAVILEPVVFDHPKDGFLQAIRDLCDRYGIVLIFDEMWTGFRLATGGAQEYYGVRADLACFSKAVANGMPLSVLCGRHDIMALLEHDVFFFTTFGGEALSLAAAAATLDVLVAEQVCDTLAATGAKLRDAYNQAAAHLGIAYTRAKGPDCRSMVAFDAEAVDPLLAKSFMQQELVRRGILWSGFHNVCAAHTEADIAHVGRAYEDVLPLLDAAVSQGRLRDAILGVPVQPVFRKTSHFDTRPRVATP